MKLLLKPAMAAGIALGAVTAVSPIAAVPAAAQTRVAVVNAGAVITNSTALKAAVQQQQTTYQAQRTQAEQRSQALSAQLQPLVTKFQQDERATTPNQQALQQQYTQIQQLQTRGRDEIQTILQPLALSQAFVQEQIEERLVQAIETVAGRQKVQLVVGPDSVLFADSAINMNQAVLDELNRALPSVQIVPPQGWEPRELREQRAAAAAQGQRTAAPAAAPAPTQGR